MSTSLIQNVRTNSVDVVGLLRGKRINIVAAPSGIMLLSDVPKQMLFHFGSYSKIKRFLKTNGTSKEKELHIPAHFIEYVGLKAVIDWMYAACRDPENIAMLKAPANSIVIACSIERALYTLGCEVDCTRVNRYIARQYFSHPLNWRDVRLLWDTLPHTCSHNRMLVRNVRRTLDNSWRVYDFPLHVPKKFRGGLRRLLEQDDELRWAVEGKVYLHCEGELGHHGEDGIKRIEEEDDHSKNMEESEEKDADGSHIEPNDFDDSGSELSYRVEARSAEDEDDEFDEVGIISNVEALVDEDEVYFEPNEAEFDDPNALFA
jgi:hypothetical protein